MHPKIAAINLQRMRFGLVFLDLCNSELRAKLLLSLAIGLQKAELKSSPPVFCVVCAQSCGGKHSGFLCFLL